MRLFFKFLLIMIVLVGFSACQKITFDYAGTPEPSSKPNYSLKFKSELDSSGDSATAEGAVGQDIVEISRHHSIPQ